MAAIIALAVGGLMPSFVYRLDDGLFLRGGYEELPYDPTTEGRIELTRVPDYRRERGGPAGLRLATEAEVAAFDRALRLAQLTPDIARALELGAEWALRRALTPAERQALTERWLQALGG